MFAITVHADPDRAALETRQNSGAAVMIAEKFIAQAETGGELVRIPGRSQRDLARALVGAAERTGTALQRCEHGVVIVTYRDGR